MVSSNGHRAAVAGQLNQLNQPPTSVSTTTSQAPPSQSRQPAAGGGPPPRSASFAQKMDYYRSQHSTKGIRVTHLVGIPGAAVSLPLLAIAPRKGLPLFFASWALQVLGHAVYEKNSPSLTKGIVTYQLCGLAFWCEEMADLLAGKGIGGR